MVIINILLHVYLDPGILSQTIPCLFPIYLYSIGKIVNKQKIVCDRIPGSRYNNLHLHDPS